jgi:hypothetical protein
VRQTLGVIHIFISCQPPKNRLTQQTCHQMLCVLAATVIRKRRTGQRGQPENVIQFPIREQPCIRCDHGAMKFQLETAVESEPENVKIRFTRRVFHDRAHFHYISS